MSMRQLVESVWILKLTGCPRLTLMSLAKPWIDGSPDPEMSQLSSVPACEFSVTIGLLCAPVGRLEPPPASAITAAIAIVNRTCDWRVMRRMVSMFIIKVGDPKTDSDASRCRNAIVENG